MKKTMFITSVIMVVVMAIALTTSSLAWFSAQGSQYVTTTALNVKASSSSATGIAISRDGQNWVSELALVSTGNTGMNPLVPFTKTTQYAPGTLTDQDLTDETNRVKDALIEALVGGSEVAYVATGEGANQNYGTASTTAYDAYMIGAKIDANKKYTAAVDRGGYYVDTFYLKNSGVGSSVKDIVTSVTISFKCDTRVYNSVSEQYENSIEDYTKTNRNTWAGEANWYDQDATLCVAVLARKAEFYEEDSDIYTYLFDSGAAYSDTALSVTEKWEIIGYAESKGNTNISLGKQAADFGTGKLAEQSIYDFAKANFALSQSSESMRPERAYLDQTLPADTKTIKVVAWFEGSTLTNNNNAQLDTRTLYFDLRFDKVEVTPAP